MTLSEPAGHAKQPNYHPQSPRRACRRVTATQRTQPTTRCSTSASNQRPGWSANFSSISTTQAWAVGAPLSVTTSERSIPSTWAISAISVSSTSPPRINGGAANAILIRGLGRRLPVDFFVAGTNRFLARPQIAFLVICVVGLVLLRNRALRCRSGEGHRGLAQLDASLCCRAGCRPLGTVSARPAGPEPCSTRSTYWVMAQ